MGSSRPSMHYNSVTNRWELRGKSGRLVQAFDDAQTPPVKTIGFVGSSAAIANTGSLMLTGTISGANLLKLGDKVMVNPKVAITSTIVGGFRVPSNSLLNFFAISPQAIGSLPALSWDVLAIRTE